MKKIVSIIIALLIMAPFIACASEELSGTYVNQKHSEAYFIFERNSVILHYMTNNGENVVPGTYKVYSNLASVTWPYDVDLHFTNKAGREKVLQMQLSANGNVLNPMDGSGLYVKK